MKYLFWLVLIVLLWWAFKRTRPSASARPHDSAQDGAVPQDMARCAHCGIHLPRDEAVRGEKGDYCSTEHRAAAQDRNPA